MRRIALAVAVLVIAVALAVLTPRLLDGGATSGMSVAPPSPSPTSCISVNFSRDCAREGAVPAPMSLPDIATAQPTR